MGNAQAGFLDAALREHRDWQIAAPSDWRARAAQQSGAAEIKAPPLGELEEVLRPYQKHGVGWMHFLRQNRFGGILADEMGLGKTLQVNHCILNHQSIIMNFHIAWIHDILAPHWNGTMHLIPILTLQIYQPKIKYYMFDRFTFSI